MEALATMQDFKKYLDTKIVIKKSFDSYYQANEDLLDLIIQEKYVDQTEKGDIPKIVEELATHYGYYVYDTKEEVIEVLESYVKEKIKGAIENIARDFYLYHSFGDFYYNSEHYDDFVNKNIDDLYKGIPRDKLFKYLVNSNNMAGDIITDYQDVVTSIYFSDGYYDDFLDEVIDYNFDFIVNEDIDYLRDEARSGDLYYIPTGKKVDNNFNYFQPELLKFYRECALDDIIGNDGLIEPRGATTEMFEIR